MTFYTTIKWSIKRLLILTESPHLVLTCSSEYRQLSIRAIYLPLTKRITFIKKFKWHQMSLPNSSYPSSFPILPITPLLNRSTQQPTGYLSTSQPSLTSVKEQTIPLTSPPPSPFESKLLPKASGEEGRRGFFPHTCFASVTASICLFRLGVLQGLR